MSVRDADATVRARLARHGDVLARLARLDTVGFADVAPPRSLQIVIGATTYALPLSGIVDLNAEQARLAKEIAKAEAEAGKTASRLDNPAFVAKAPEDVILENRERLADLNALAERLRAASRQIAG